MEVFPVEPITAIIKGWYFFKIAWDKLFKIRWINFRFINLIRIKNPETSFFISRIRERSFDFAQGDKEGNEIDDNNDDDHNNDKI